MVPAGDATNPVEKDLGCTSLQHGLEDWCDCPEGLGLMYLLHCHYVIYFLWGENEAPRS